MLPPRNDQVKTLSVHEPMEELRPQAQEELPLRPPQVLTQCQSAVGPRAHHQTDRVILLEEEMVHPTDF